MFIWLIIVGITGMIAKLNLMKLSDLTQVVYILELGLESFIYS